MKDIFESPETYRQYLTDLSLLDLEGIERRIDGDTYPERLQLVLDEIDRKLEIAEERVESPDVPLIKRLWWKVFPKSPFRKD